MTNVMKLDGEHMVQYCKTPLEVGMKLQMTSKTSNLN